MPTSSNQLRSLSRAEGAQLVSEAMHVPGRPDWTFDEIREVS